jgi:phage/plasmid-associated DNA primase
VRAATAEYRDESDDFAGLLDERLVLEDGARETAAHLYEEYRRWAEAQGLAYPFTKKKFGMMLTERGYGMSEKDWRTSQAIRTGCGSESPATTPLTANVKRESKPRRTRRLGTSTS